MSLTSPNQSVKVAIVGMTGSGKTVLISTLAMKMAQMALEDIFMAPFGDNRRHTLRYTQSNWKALNEGRWPVSTPAGELIELQWELTTKNHQAQVQFLDCAGQDIRSLFQTDSFDPNRLRGNLNYVYRKISSANILIFLVNMKDLLATPNFVDELMDLDQMFHALNERNDIPRKMAVVFSQFDKYKPEVDQKFNGDFLEYLRHYIPYLHGQYIREHNFEIIPVAAVNDTQNVIEDGEVKQKPVPGFSSYNLEKLIHWIADSVEELAPQLEDSKHCYLSNVSSTTDISNKSVYSNVLPLPAFSHADDPFITSRLNLSPPYPEQLLTPSPQYALGDISKPFYYMTTLYVSAYFVWLVLLILAAFFIKVHYDYNHFMMTMAAYEALTFIISALCLLGGLFYEMRLLYRCWSVVQDGYAWTTPDKAIQMLYFPLLLFFPIINIYWLYVNMYGLSKCLNDYVKRYQLHVRPSSKIVMFLTCLSYNIPYLNLVLPILFLPFALYSVMRTARDIQALKLKQAAERSESEFNQKLLVVK